MTDEEVEEADDEAAEDAADEESEGFDEDDFVQIEYTARTVEEGDLVDTTDPEVAEEADVDTEGRDFGARTIVIGSGQIFDAVEDDLVGKTVGDEGTVVVPTEAAFGEYDPEEVRTVSADRIPEDERYPGAQVEVDGERGHVETIIGGRARVDFNHPLAGADVEYEYEVTGEVTDRVERAQELLRTYFDTELEMRIETDDVEEETTVETDEGETETETEVVEQETLYIDSDPQLQFNQQWMMGKQQIAGELIDRIGVDRVIIQEIIDGQGGMPMGMGGVGGAGAGGIEDIEEAVEGADVDADEIVEELDTGDEE
jgi:FKBP-type peptidyl-prolyl cis-trans isomerase SlyD